jgi:hypothetical protein
MLRVITTIMSDVETIVGCSRIYARSFCGERDDVFRVPVPHKTMKSYTYV